MTKEITIKKMTIRGFFSFLLYSILVIIVVFIIGIILLIPIINAIILFKLMENIQEHKKNIYSTVWEDSKSKFKVVSQTKIIEYKLKKISDGYKI